MTRNTKHKIERNEPKMKKVLSLLLAVVLVCSMATVAFGIEYKYECDRCHGGMNDSEEYITHIASVDCAACPHCDYGFISVEQRDRHQPDCRLFSGTCDYCGASVCTERAFNAHVDACKTKYFYIPLYKLCKAIENFTRTTDWNNIANIVANITSKVKSFVLFND